MGLNLLVLLIFGGLTSAGAWFVARATGHQPLARVVLISIWGLIELGLAVDLLTSQRRARAVGVRPRRADHLLALAIVGAVLLVIWLVAFRFQ